MNSTKIFISHSATDKDWARSFAEALQQRGAFVRFDELYVQADEVSRDALEADLRASDIFVALLDPRSSPSPNLLFELGAAIGMGKRVVSVVPENFDATSPVAGVRLRQSLIRDTPEQTADHLSHVLEAA